MKKTAIALMLASAMGLGACTNMDKTSQGAVSGGAIGAGVGAAAGAITGGDPATGAAVGGAIGAAGGAYKGCKEEGRRNGPAPSQHGAGLFSPRFHPIAAMFSPRCPVSLGIIEALTFQGTRRLPFTDRRSR
jgi:hypothetical protein